MAKLLVALALAAPLAGSAATLHAQEAGQYRGANPIRKVVNLLTAMQEKVTEEGKKEEALFEKYMCYCHSSERSLKESIEQGKAQIAKQETAGAAVGEKKAQVEADLKAHKASRDEAKDTIAKATAIREKEAATFASESADAKQNLEALGKAIAAIERGSGAGFLQTKAGSVLQRFVMYKAELADGARQDVLAFLSGSTSEGYEPQSGQALGILKQMKDTMQKNLVEATAAEEAAARSFKDLVAAKKKEIEALQEQIEEEQLRVGELSVEGASGGNDLEAVKRTLVENEKLLAELKETCAAKSQQWEEIKKSRGEEIAAISETIKVLNDDDNLDLFKKALPSGQTSFLQLQVSAAALRAKALATLRAASARTPIPHPQLDLIALALNGKQAGFEKVVKMIDDLVANLHKEQKDDDDKKAYCAEQFDQSEDKQKELELAIATSEASIEEVEGNINRLREEIKALKQGVKDLDAAVAQATAQRQAEHADHEEMMQSDTAAKDVLAWAKNRLNKFYNPKLYKPEFAQVSSDDAPPEFPAMHSKSESGANVIQMIDTLIADLDKEMQTGEVNEKHAQKEYEKMLDQARSKRAQDSEAITEKESSVAALEEGLQAEHDRKEGSEAELAATMDYLRNLHNECDWLLQYYQVRKDAREGEIEALEKGKAVLSGADFSLVQTGVAHRSRQFLAARRT